jgi:hypothetical protein
MIASANTPQRSIEFAQTNANGREKRCPRAQYREASRVVIFPRRVP